LTLPFHDHGVDYELVIQL